ncbi:MAG TPA: alpha/beta fold hydrolase [Gaiella sp.]|jgi:pimeloyl-ACP methyl ester carboxylesterase/DNA-binding CsgD family transcriptional regulator|nr:alpha/beta fold hydrolase [Gaiella sp.]
MEQDIRFCELDGRRIAYATVGEGPLLLFGGRWVTHLEEEWEEPRARAFFEDLARSHRVVRYDRLGAGVSDRALTAPPTPEAETRQLAAVFEACGGGRATIFASSCAGLATARFASEFPERVDRLVFFGGYASRDDIPPATRDSLVDFVRANWMLAAQMLAGLFVPRAGGEEIEALSRYQRRAAEADVASAFLELDLVQDARPVLPRVTAPALVLHRRGDRTVPIGRGRELAALLPNARFVALRGDSHLPWMDDQRDLQRALAGFLGDDAPVEANGDSPLSARETEVLRLVAAGLSNREIASSLVLSEHTVHRHVANVLRKLSQSSRAAAAAHATRAGYI